MEEKRNGPGRPRIKQGETTQPYTVSLTPNEAESIREIGDGNLTEGVRKMLGINQHLRKEIVINDRTYAYTQDWLGEYNLYDGGKHLGTFHFSPGGRLKPGQSNAFKNPYGCNMFYVEPVGNMKLFDYESTVEAACARIVRELENTGSSQA